MLVRSDAFESLDFSDIPGMSAMELESAAKAETETAAQAVKIISAGELLLKWRGKAFEWIMFDLWQCQYTRPTILITAAVSALNSHLL